jgi:hypothetical protein
MCTPALSSSRANSSASPCLQRVEQLNVASLVVVLWWRICGFLLAVLVMCAGRKGLAVADRLLVLVCLSISTLWVSCLFGFGIMRSAVSLPLSQELMQWPSSSIWFTVSWVWVPWALLVGLVGDDGVGEEGLVVTRNGLIYEVYVGPIPLLVIRFYRVLFHLVSKLVSGIE